MYMDHAGATPYPLSIIRDHLTDLSTNLLSNPHSQSPSSIATGNRVESVRQQVLQFFRADPKSFEVVFVANATAGIKLIADGFAGSVNGFRYKYLRDAHTSLVGVSALALEHKPLSEDEVDEWLKSGLILNKGNINGLFAYPAQSNFNGQRFPLEWIHLLRKNCPGWYSLLDASSLLTTTPLEYSDAMVAPDFTVFSFYKIFGYPDLGAIIVRRDAAHMLIQRRFFGGGTRAALTVEAWNLPHEEIHEALEDGTLPFHTILALEASFYNHTRLFGAHINVARHAAAVTRLAHSLLSSLTHYNGETLCKIYSTINQGPIIAFNLVSAGGSPIGYKSVEKELALRNFAVRTGGMCNPGGVEKYMELGNGGLEHLFRIGKVCGDQRDIINGRNIGVIRVSFGASSTFEEVYALVDFLRDFYVEKTTAKALTREIGPDSTKLQSVYLCISPSLAALMLDPIKSCHAYYIPPEIEWPITPNGLLYDRKYFLISARGNPLSAEQYPKMSLIKPILNLKTEVMSVSSPVSTAHLEVPLNLDVLSSVNQSSLVLREDKCLCGDRLRSLIFTSPHIQDFFSTIVGVKCSLAMYYKSASEQHRDGEKTLSRMKKSKSGGLSWLRRGKQSERFSEESLKLGV